MYRRLVLLRILFFSLVKIDANDRALLGLLNLGLLDGYGLHELGDVLVVRHRGGVTARLLLLLRSRFHELLMQLGKSFGARALQIFLSNVKKIV